jgi:hypothetical protein
MKLLLFLFFFWFFLLLASYLLPTPKKQKRRFAKEKSETAENAFLFQQTKNKAALTRQAALQNGFSSRYAFLVDMSLPSGKNRFFIYDLTRDTVAFSGLVAHGSCNTPYLPEPQFANTPECGCTSLGRYKLGEAYQGRFGKAFRLHGLDSTNRNAFQRNIVLHGYKDIPDNEVHPQLIPKQPGLPDGLVRFSCQSIPHSET